MEPGQNTEAHRPGSPGDIRELLDRARESAAGAAVMASHRQDPEALAAVSSAWSELAVAEMHAAMFAVPRVVQLGPDQDRGDIHLVDTSQTVRPL